jgi:hypothetical protein
MRSNKKPPPAKRTTPAKPSETSTEELVTMIQQNNKEMLSMFIEIIKQLVGERGSTINNNGAPPIEEWRVTFNRNDDYLVEEMILKAVVDKNELH